MFSLISCLADQHHELLAEFSKLVGKIFLQNNLTHASQGKQSAELEYRLGLEALETCHENVSVSLPRAQQQSTVQRQDHMSALAATGHSLAGWIVLYYLYYVVPACSECTVHLPVYPGPGPTGSLCADSGRQTD